MAAEVEPEVGDPEFPKTPLATVADKLARALTDAIVAQAQGHPRRAPPYTLPGELLRERAAGPAGTAMERLAAQGRWGS